MQEHISAIGARPTILQRLDIGRQRESLRARIKAYHTHWPSILEKDILETDENDMDWLTLDDDDVLENPFLDHHPVPTGCETHTVLFPSTIGADQCRKLGLKKHMEAELQLRCGQANDALEGIRMGVGKKAYLYRAQVRPAQNKTAKTRAYVKIHNTDKSVLRNARIYRQARAAIIRLEPSADVLAKYKELLKSHLTTSTTLLDPQIAGQRHTPLPWFWAHETGRGVTDTILLDECEFHFRPSRPTGISPSW